VKDNLQGHINETFVQYGSDAQMIAMPNDPKRDRAKVCTITLSVYVRIMSLQPGRSSALIRSMNPDPLGTSSDWHGC
jgi:hypothetical protein